VQRRLLNNKNTSKKSAEALLKQKQKKSAEALLKLQKYFKEEPRGVS
jgi:hypothetical protein